ISDSYAMIENSQVYLVNLHISPYEASGADSHDPYRRRRLLLHKREIRKLINATAEKGLTLVPLRFYFKGPYVKVELATARGRKKYDKREIIAKKEARRTIQRAKQQDKS
ncbi:MAG: SsrA-binding protein, partial [candidate division Zixibacteria bacterium]|nr:SsrA-binding protein [candidate division Zixibacteria bacterium]